MDTFARGTLTFDVLDGGPADGDVVLLLHGFPQSARSWDHIAPRLQDAGYRTFAPDQRGYSPRARPTGRRAYVLAELVEDARAALDAAGAARAHVVGHDWGAAVAWGLAAAHPDRVRSLTALSVPHQGAFLRAMVRGTQLPHSWYMAALQVPAAPEWLLGPGSAAGRSRLVSSLTGSGLPAAAAERDALFLSGPGALTAALAWYRAIPFADRRAAAGGLVRVPTTYVWSDRDRFVTRAAALGCGRYVEAPYRFEILRGVDHWIPDNAADVVTPLILDQLRAV